VTVNRAAIEAKSPLIGRPPVAAAMNLLSGLLTAAPFICVAALVAIFVQVRFVLGSWPLVYGDDPGDWVVMVAGLIAFAAYAVSLAGLALWVPATVLAARLNNRPLLRRRLLVFAAGWVLLAAIRMVDSSGHLATFLG
jgi:hypothetical protein